MRSIFSKALLGLGVAGTMVAAATPAHAGDDAAYAIAGGIVGLGVGAAIASSNHGYYDRGYYDRGYYGNDRYRRYGYDYDQPYYNGYYRNGYYGNSYYNNGYYDNGYYSGYSRGYSQPYYDNDDYYSRYGSGYGSGYGYGDGRYAYRDRCYMADQWDAYTHERVRVRVCR